jgi:hypothetical protein
MFPGITDKSKHDTIVYGSGMGLQIDARYNIGHYFGWPQLFAGVGYAFGGAGDRQDVTAGPYTIATTGGYSGLTIFAMQRFYISRFTVGGEVAYEPQNVGDVLGSATSTVIAFGANVGVALARSINFEAKVRYEMGGKVDLEPNWEHSGLGIQAGFVYSPASLPFDPVDYVRGRMGL